MTKPALVMLLLLALLPANAHAATPVPALVSALTGNDPVGGQKAAEEAFARSGVATAEGRHVFRRAVAPATGASISRREALNAALDAEGPPNQQRLTLADLGVFWGKLGLTPKGEDPGIVLRGRLKAWLLAARAHPSSPMAFPIVLLAALAQRRGIDVAAANYNPASYGLGMLETQLFTGALMRMPKGAIKVKSRVAAKAAAVASCSDVLDEWITNALKYYGFKGPAADAIKFIVTTRANQVTKEGGKYAAGGLVYVGLGETESFEASKKAAGNIMSALSLLFQIERLANIYGGVRFYVDVPQPSVEKPEQLQNQPALGYGTFVATAGLTDDLQKKVDDAMKNGGKDFDANRKAVKDCAKQLGFPVPYFDTDVAADIDKFRVQWTLHADPGDAVYEFQKTKWFAPGSRIGLLTRAAPALAAHVFYAKIQPQQPWSYAPQLFEQRSHDASPDAELQTDKALDPKMLIGLVTSGGKSLFGPLTTTILGMLEKLHTIKDTGDLEITYHVPKCQGGGGGLARAAQDVCQQPMSATFSGRQECMGGCLGGDNLRYDWTGSMVGQPYVSPFPIPTGFLGWTIKSGSAHVVVSGTVGDQASGTCEVHASGDVDLIAANGASTPVFTLNPGTPQTYQLTLSSGANPMTLSYDNCTAGRTPPAPFTAPISIPLTKTASPIARPSPTGPINFTGGESSGNSTFSWSWTISGV
jgi:hypothetical protein